MLKKPLAVLLILLSGIISWLIAMVNMPLDRMEMGAILNFFGPPFILAGSLIVFFIIDFISPKVRSYNVGALCFVNFFAGMYIRYWSIDQLTFHI